MANGKTTTTTAQTTRLQVYQTRLEAYYAAEMAILEGAQSYKIGSRNLTRANLAEISDMIKYLEQRVSAEKAAEKGHGRNRVTGVIPRDF